MPLAQAAVELFRCPACHADVELADTAVIACGVCGLRIDAGDGVVDFVPEAARGPERTFYDAYYAQSAVPAALPSGAELAAAWTGPEAAWEMRRVWSRLGELRDRTVLLLGNGESPG